MTTIKINSKKEAEKILSFIKNTFQKQGFNKAVIGLSGGIDSSTCLVLLTKALGAKNVFVLKMPYGKQNMAKAAKMIKLTQIPQNNVYEVNIEPIANSFLSAISYKLSAINQLRLGNIMVRTRMILTYDLAKAKQALVCGTENKSEYLLGYFTLFGDEAADFSPIQHLYKTQVISLAKYLNLPQEIIKQKPTAGMWPNQTDEQELGFSYEESDPILYLFFEQRLKLIQILKKGFNKQLIEKVLQRVKNNLYKHQIPYTLNTNQ